jgi:hypothetical protein
MKLELKHLSPYLPYGLKCRSDMPGNTIFEMRILSNNNAYEDDRSCRWGIGTFKPLLTPLSELTNSQWIDVIIAGDIVLEREQTYDMDFEWDKENDLLIIGIPHDGGREHIKFSKHFMAFGGSLWINQLAAFNKLYELHADVYGLIESGCALNKNSLNK